MRTLAAIAAGLFALTLAAPTGAWAQGKKKKGDDAPIPFPDEGDDEEEGRRELPRRSDETPTVREESDYEKDERDDTLAGLDDPNVGLSGELLGGMLLLDSSKGNFVEPRFMWGLRFTWEYGRLLSDEAMRERLWGDVTWSYAGLRDGTAQLFGDSNYHYFTVAPAYGFPIGGKTFSFYGQAGVGLGYQFSSLHIKDVETQIGGTKLLVQYGVGLRGRPALSADEKVRISFRFELTRFRRGYMDDTFIGGSAGATF